ncbi:MAG: type II toxin-antitoxin system RatA family toxin [Methyloligellaceae bacterium]
MRTFQTTRRVAHAADKMFALVADMERYPEFLPLCKALELQSSETIGGKDVLTADMTVAYKFIRESFTTRVTLDREARQILVEYLDGPFKYLENRWEFRAAGEAACDVKFYLAYKFRSRALQLMMGAVFDQAFGKFAEAFEARADSIYGAEDRISPLT